MFEPPKRVLVVVTAFSQEVFTFFFFALSLSLYVFFKNDFWVQLPLGAIQDPLCSKFVCSARAVRANSLYGVLQGARRLVDHFLRYRF